MNRSAAQAQNDDASEVVKVNPYPFDVELTGREGTLKAEALKLVVHGLMLDAQDGVLKVGENYEIHFQLPAEMGILKQDVKVIKTYDRKVPGKDGPITQRLAEVHFTKPLRDLQKQKVKDFLKRIQQTGTDLV